LFFVLPVLVYTCIIFMVTSSSSYIWMTVLSLFRYIVKRVVHFFVLKYKAFYFSRLIPLEAVGNS